MPDVEINLDNGKNLWSNLLQEVKEKSSKTAQIPISLLVLGNEGSGKSSLIARLQKSDPKHGVGLEFDYIEIMDESIDENKKISVWISPGDTYHTNLLKYALNERNFGNTCCLITVSLSEPWNLIDSLEEWLKILKKHIDRLKLNPQDMKYFKESLYKQFQEYCEPDLEKETQVVVGKRRDTDFNYLHPIINEDPDKILIPLEDGIFDDNLGIPIIIIITKTDSISTLEQEFDFNDDQFDFIQMHLRKICLKYGATLCYTSLKDDRNCDLLLNYLLHRCYGFSMTRSASVIEKDAIFIPSGWDSFKKIAILSENIPVDIRTQIYNSLISKPLSLVRASALNRLTEPDVAEDEQIFLMRQQAIIQRNKVSNSADGGIRGDSSKGGSPLPSSSMNRNRKNLPGLTSSPSNASNMGAQQGNEGVLANFFSSLLNKRGTSTGSPLPNQTPGSGDNSRCDDVVSETDESQKDELSLNSPLSTINNTSSTPLKLKESNELINQVDTIEEKKENLNIENSENKNVSESLAEEEPAISEVNG